MRRKTLHSGSPGAGRLATVDTSIASPIGRRETCRVIMYPDLNDWVALGSVLSRTRGDRRR